ncbi:hypothetical protein BB561_002538 [Smittium simulii]|uniref:Cns1/TTC4 wheel domain-containing protein n=1 Tax=Smittium simulii TaxID=133385 RepID=A0A2T9YQ05_9FUNG|nr:hypothetical protein BB561_002538 [Smittium simulii]
MQDTPIIGPEKERPKWALDPNNLDEGLAQVPLFMRQSPSESDASENVTLQALQSLIYEGNPDEIAENFKDQGNECFKSKDFSNAAKFYSQGLEQQISDSKLIESLLLNRAAANLEIRNYRKVISDCSQTLKINTQSVKALYRASKALLAIDKVDEAIDCSLKALELDSKNTSVYSVLNSAQNKKLLLAKKKAEADARLSQLLQEKIDIDTAIEKRSLNIVANFPSKTYYIGQHKRTSAKWENKTGNFVSLNRDGNLEWPVFFLYPEFKESDFINHFDETNTIYEHLLTVLEYPPPFDNQDSPAYTPENVNCYFTYLPEGCIQNTNSDLLVKVDVNMTLGKLLQNPKYTIYDGIPNIIVLPMTGNFTTTYLNDYRKRRDAYNKSLK